MPFILFVLFSALSLEFLGTGVSVIGLSALFSGSAIVIALAICLDIAKIASVTFLYKFWKKINWGMRTYMLIASIVLMMITSVGAFGFLSGKFQQAIAVNGGQNVILAALTEEQARHQKRKEEIDRQIAQLPENNVRGRSLLMRQFGPEISRLNSRLAEIDKELPKLQVDAIHKNVEIGPIIYVAEAFDTTPEKAVKWIILLIIFVFDPLAVALLLAANFLFEQRRLEKEKKEEKQDNKPVAQQPETPPMIAPIAPIIETPVVSVSEITSVVKAESIIAPTVQPTIEVAVPAIESVVEVATPVIEPVVEPVIEPVEVVEVVKPIVEQVARSTLENVSTRSDVSEDDDARRGRAMSGLLDQYKDDFIKTKPANKL